MAVSLGERLKEARKKRKWSQRKLAEEAGVNHVTVSKIETNKEQPTQETVSKLANALGCGSIWLFYGEKGGDQGQQQNITNKDIFWEEFHNKVDQWRRIAAQAGEEKWLKRQAQEWLYLNEGAIQRIQQEYEARLETGQDIPGNRR